MALNLMRMKAKAKMTTMTTTTSKTMTIVDGRTKASALDAAPSRQPTVGVVTQSRGTLESPCVIITYADAVVRGKARGIGSSY